MENPILWVNIYHQSKQEHPKVTFTRKSSKGRWQSRCYYVKTEERGNRIDFELQPLLDYRRTHSWMHSIQVNFVPRASYRQ